MVGVTRFERDKRLICENHGLRLRDSSSSPEGKCILTDSQTTLLEACRNTSNGRMYTGQETLAPSQPARTSPAI